MNNLTIVTYHYVRNPEETPYPRMNACRISEFEAQLRYFRREYTPVRLEDCLFALEKGSKPLPKNAILLTFDDGFIDHYRFVFPRLMKAGMHGCFFPCGRTIVENVVLDVHKIHFLLASLANTNELIAEIFALVDQSRKEWNLPSSDILYTRFAHPSMFDDRQTAFVKRILQRELPFEVRSSVIRTLFYRYITTNELSFARSLYLNRDQLQEMRTAGMAIGSHGFQHEWLNLLSPKDQEKEVVQAIRVLHEVGVFGGWVMSYPYGASSHSLISTLKRYGCTLAFTTRPAMAVLETQHRFTLPRFDTNHFRSQDRRA